MASPCQARRVRTGRGRRGRVRPRLAPVVVGSDYLPSPRKRGQAREDEHPPRKPRAFSQSRLPVLNHVDGATRKHQIEGPVGEWKRQLPAHEEVHSGRLLATKVDQALGRIDAHVLHAAGQQRAVQAASTAEIQDAAFSNASAFHQLKVLQHDRVLHVRRPHLWLQLLDRPRHARAVVPVGGRPAVANFESSSRSTPTEEDAAISHGRQSGWQRVGSSTRPLLAALRCVISGANPPHGPRKPLSSPAFDRARAPLLAMRMERRSTSQPRLGDSQSAASESAGFLSGKHGLARDPLAPAGRTRDPGARMSSLSPRASLVRRDRPPLARRPRAFPVKDRRESFGLDWAYTARPAGRPMRRLDWAESGRPGEAASARHARSRAGTTWHGRRADSGCNLLRNLGGTLLAEGCAEAPCAAHVVCFFLSS